MINKKSVLAIIPARGGSKGIPYKNICQFAGKPLIAWTIQEAKKSKYIDRTILSSDDKKIISVAKKFGCEVPFIRPANLALDDTPGIKVVLHAIDEIGCKYDYVVLLQPTSPMRTFKDIDSCLKICEENLAPVCVSLCEPEKSPYWMFRIDPDERLVPLIHLEQQSPNRQNLPKAYSLNGAVYVARTDWLKSSKTFLAEETISYLMPRERSLDIDTKLDLKICEIIFIERLKKRRKHSEPSNHRKT